MRAMMMITALAVMAGDGAIAQTPKTNAASEMDRAFGGGGLRGKKLEKAIAKADAHPLGSEMNPVRSDMPSGERAYLSRLRCADGTAPAFSRSGSVGESPYGYIMDLYSVTCPGAKSVSVYLDMYHVHVEARPLPGFTIVAP